MTRIEIILDILEFQEIGINWDGHGGFPPTDEVMKNTLIFFGCLDDESLRKVTDYFPNPHATISVEFGNKTSLEIGNETFSYFSENGELRTIFADHKLFNVDEIGKFINLIKNQ